MATDRVWSGEAKIELTRMIEEGMRTLHEMETLRDGLNDTIKAVAEKLEVKPAILKRAIKIAHKASLHEEKKNHEDVNTILEITGKTL